MQQNSLTIPTHVGYIIDGNRRWAKEHGLPSIKGHQQGYKSLKEVAYESFELGVKYVSAYIFSTENWKRPAEEVSGLMKLTLRIAEKEVDNLVQKGIRVRFLGSTERLSKKIIDTLRRCEAKSAHCTKGTLAICFNYGGQEEIVRACKEVVKKGLKPTEITLEKLREHLYTPDVPDIDLVVRTSGEQRLSNFMMWRTAYSEFIFLDKKWPEMTKADVHVVLDEYSRRNRRFGGN